MSGAGMTFRKIDTEKIGRRILAQKIWQAPWLNLAMRVSDCENNDDAVR
jgi:hypothetical protein